MGFRVKEIFFSVQGEGVQAGQAALFCRFSGCNLWSGKEEDRANAKCTFCDTDFVGSNGFGGGLYHDEYLLIRALLEALPRYSKVTFPTYKPLIVLTGGEPALQITQKLIDLLHENNFFIAIETNGTLPLPKHIDWVCVSPKTGGPLRIKRGNELKLVWPQKGLRPEQFTELRFDHFVLQPCDNQDAEKNMKACMAYCLSNPMWRLGLQIHKVLGIE